MRENSLRGLRGPCQPGLLGGFHPALPSCLAVASALQSCLDGREHRFGHHSPPTTCMSADS